MSYKIKRQINFKYSSWFFIPTLIISGVVFFSTGNLILALVIAGIDVILKTICLSRRTPKSFVLWFTGLSGSGKSTLAREIYSRLKQKGLRVEHLDGDVVRDVFPNTGFSRQERNEHIKRIGFLASLLERNGVAVICSFISPYEESRQFVRNLCQNYIEVHVKTSLEECEKRDVKGLYQKARLGQINNFTGISDPYETPSAPQIVVDTEGQSVERSVAQLMDEINKRLCCS